ncbi:unnamed protein product, partial [marine sediment metagenome]
MTEERLAQYDLVVLQNPILPYNPLEFNNLKNYFENGGNLLFLGTRYQDLCVENINELFSYIDLNITINEENVANEEWIGVGATVSTQSITNFNNSLIFQGVSKFSWEYGSTLSVMENAEAIASTEDKIIAAAYDHNSFEGGLYKGVAPGISIINAKAGDATGLEEGDIISAIQWSANTANADIISMSFGDSYPIASDLMILALASVTENGIITVSSAGNSGPEYLSGGS